MTTRLKRKLDNIGVDISSSKLTESFCLIGTPLPSLDKAKDQNEFLPAWKQDVRDEQGRRRLHGAFTGGFSAGYFNTVGSKEGWTPQTFKSSRTSRASGKGARPEDFMDEEDLEELRNSQKIIDTTEEMDLLGGTQAESTKRSSADNDDSLANVLAASLLPSARDSSGAQLLKKMGWRPGQGIGPRVTFDQLQKQDLQSSDLPLSSKMEETDHDDEAVKHTFAPRDTKVTMFRAKDNAFGLGFSGNVGLSQLIDEKASTSGPNLSSGFGLGALNDAEDDDVDVYDQVPGQRSGRTLAYDLHGPSYKVTLGSEKPDKRTKMPQMAMSTDTFQDGRPVLPGFGLDRKPVVEETWFKIPDVPSGWKPDPQKMWNLGTAVSSSIGSVGPGRVDMVRFKVDGKTLAEERGSRLGETALPGQSARSVFDYLSQKDRDRLHTLSLNPVVDSEKLVDVAAAQPSSVSITYPRLDAPVAQSALRGFQPFTADPAKQARYDQYLRSQASAPSSVEQVAPPAPKPGQAVDDFNKEMEDYAKAALIFKPISGAMANRFTTASIIDTGPKVQEGLHTPSDATSKLFIDPSASDTAKTVVTETPKQNAARLGMYGPLTREVQDWAPGRLLCKRFGITNPRPDPNPGDEEHGNLPPKQASKPGIPWEPSGLEAPNANTSETLTTSESTHTKLKDIFNIGLGEDDDQGRDTLTYQRPAMNVFKAIFASDDEESDDDDVPSQIAPIIAPEVATPAVTNTEISPTLVGSQKLPNTHIDPATTEVVDSASFRPKFIPKSQREGKAPSSPSVIDSPKPEKPRKSQPRKSLISFGMDDEAGGLSVTPDVKTKKKKKVKGQDKKRPRDNAVGDEGLSKRARLAGADISAGEDGDEWIEKPPTLTAESMLDRVDETSKMTPNPSITDPTRTSRPKALDFL